MAHPFSTAVAAEGPLLFVSGQDPQAPDGGVAGDVAGQTDQIFRKLRAVLSAHDADLGRVVKLTYYLRHIADLGEFRSAMAGCLPDGHRPAATLVEVSGLVDPRFLVQVDAIASLSQERPRA